MGTKVHCKSYWPGYYSMRDLNEDSSSSSWPVFCADNGIPNGQYYNGFIPRNIINGYPAYDKDALKQKMLEHESVFRNQVYELHRLYRVQRDMMEEVKGKELYGRGSGEQSSSSSHQASQVPSEDARKSHLAVFPLLNTGYGKPSISPMSCTKGNTTQAGWFPFQNGSTPDDCEVLDSRPLKVRKKLFDLQLPADEYVDTDEGEKLTGYKVSHLSSNAPTGNPNSDPNASASASCLRNSTGLADLNEPVHTDEAPTPSSFDFLGHTPVNRESKGMHDKSNADHVGVAREAMYIRDGFLMNSSIESKVHEMERLSRGYEAGPPSNSNFSSLSQGLRQDKFCVPSHPVQRMVQDKFCVPSHPVQGMVNHIHQPSGMYPIGYYREDIWRHGIHHSLQSSDRNRDHSSNANLEPAAPSQVPSSYPFFSSSSPWAHPNSSWARPTNGFMQKMTTFESSQNSASTMDRNLLPSAQSLETLRGKLAVNASSRSNPCFGNEVTTLNGSNHGFASSSKEQHSHVPAGFDFLNCSRGDNVASDRLTNHGLGNFQKNSCFAYAKPAIDINLNEVLSKSSLDEVVIVQDLNMVDGKCKPEEHLAALPWLKPKPAHGNRVASTRKSEFPRDSSYQHAPRDQFCGKGEAVQDLNQLYSPEVTLASRDCEVVREKETAKNQNVQKILGFPIFETGVSTSASGGCPTERKTVNNERKNRIIDINLEYEPDEPIDAEELSIYKEKPIQSTGIRDLIDLNSCISDCEDPSAPCYETKSASVKITLEIDLEAPALPESEDDNSPSKTDKTCLKSLETKHVQIQDEVLRNAAEAIVSISASDPQIHIENSICHPSEASLAESLLWFVDAMSSCAKEIDTSSVNESLVKDGSPKPCFSEEIDDFEVMTLQQAEMKEEDYMPTPFVPEILKVEDTGTNTVSTRSRRGQARRGRQRRDFQRDILPGLTSLSRHEVTEDIQTFGGMMRATGHSWSSGLARRNGARNGGGRGRRKVVVEAAPPVMPAPVCAPLVQQLNNIGAALEETGWGKTPRRPRRQRCPSGNPPTVVST